MMTERKRMFYNYRDNGNEALDEQHDPGHHRVPCLPAPQTAELPKQERLVSDLSTSERLYAT